MSFIEDVEPSVLGFTYILDGFLFLLEKSTTGLITGNTGDDSDAFSSICLTWSFATFDWLLPILYYINYNRNKLNINYFMYNQIIIIILIIIIYIVYSNKSNPIIEKMSLVEAFDRKNI